VNYIPLQYGLVYADIAGPVCSATCVTTSEDVMSFFKGVGWLLLIGFVAWLGFSLSRYPVRRPPPSGLAASSGFEGASPLPDSETKPHFDHAREKMLAVNSRGQTFSVADNLASWATFLSTAAVTLILGYFGRRAPAANEAADVSGLPLRLGRLIGVLAALAAVLTAGGALARNQARDNYDKADKTRDLINATTTDLRSATSQAEAHAVLDKLDLEIGRL
jgi:hypothetical protein